MVYQKLGCYLQLCIVFYISLKETKCKFLKILKEMSTKSNFTQTKADFYFHVQYYHGSFIIYYTLSVSLTSESTASMTSCCVLKIYLYYYMCMNISLHVCAPHVLLVLAEPRRSSRSLRTGVTGCCKIPYGCWETSPHPLEEQPMLITTGPSHQPQNPLSFISALIYFSWSFLYLHSFSSPALLFSCCFFLYQ